MKQKNLKKCENILQFTALILLLCLLNIHAEKFFFRIDLTQEKRYSISAATKELLRELNDEVYVEIYLAGQLNTSFKRLQKSIRETLQEFKVYAGSNIQYRFIDPNQATKAQDRRRFHQQLIDKGIQATTLFDVVDGKKIQKVIFPSALVSYKHKEAALLLLKGSKTVNAQQQLNQSIEAIEYELASSIKKLSAKSKKTIAWLQGHGGPEEKQLTDIITAIDEQYVLDRVNLQTNTLDAYHTLLILSPEIKFSDIEKFKIDQYVMQGGNVLFLIKNIQMHTDSIQQGGTYAFQRNLELEDMLFKYGVRINADLIQDQQAGLIDVFVGYMGDKPNIQKIPWPYYIYLNKFGKHPIVRHLDVVYSEYLSTIDTIQVKGIKKTPLLFSSKYTKVRQTPIVIDLNELKKDQSKESYPQAHLPVAYLLEGSFQSVFTNRFLPKKLQGSNLIKQGKNAKIIVVSDGNCIVQKLDKKNNRTIPIDYDINRRQQLSNKAFIMNALAYLTDEKGIITSRNKQITLRLLDTLSMKEQKFYWQTLNLVLPVLMVMLFGLGRFYWRKRKYEM